MRKCYIYGIYRKDNPDNIIYVGQHNYINKNDCYMGSGKKIKEIYKKEEYEKYKTLTKKKRLNSLKNI